MSVTVGSQEIMSDPFEFEIIDCEEHVGFPVLENVFVQVDSEVSLLDTKAQSTNEFCQIGEYQALGVDDYVAMEADG